MPGIRQFEDVQVRKITAQRLRAKYGIRRRAFFTPNTKADVAVGGTISECYLTLPKKGRIIGLGFQSAASDVVLATGDTLEVRSTDGTIFASFVSGSDYTLATGRATMRENHPTGTWLATNKPLVFYVHGTNPGVSGSIYPFVDYEPSDKGAI